MDQPECPEQGMDFEFLFLVTVVVSALLALEYLHRTRSGQVHGLYPLACVQTVLTLGNCGYFFTQALQALAETDPNDPAAIHSAYAAMVSVGLDFISALIQWQLVQSQRDSGQPPQEPITS